MFFRVVIVCDKSGVHRDGFAKVLFYRLQHIGITSI